VTRSRKCGCISFDVEAKRHLWTLGYAFIRMFESTCTTDGYLHPYSQREISRPSSRQGRYELDASSTDSVRGAVATAVPTAIP